MAARKSKRSRAPAETPLPKIDLSAPVAHVASTPTGSSNLDRDDARQALRDTRCILSVLAEFHLHQQDCEVPDVGWGHYLILRHAADLLTSVEESLTENC